MTDRITPEEAEKLWEEKKDKMRLIVNIFTRPGQTLDKIAADLNELINAEPTQKEKDFLLAAILMLYKQIICGTPKSRKIIN
jgi:hypothetical protein